MTKTTTESSEVRKINREKVAACMTCPLCDNFFRDATTISECLHTFCRECIYDKITEEDLRSCPVCNVELGCSPLEKLRADNNMQDIRSKIFPSTKQNSSAPKAVSSSPPLPPRRKERSLSSLVIGKPKLPAKSILTGRKSRARPRKNTVVQQSSFPVKKPVKDVEARQATLSSPQTFSETAPIKKEIPFTAETSKQQQAPDEEDDIIEIIPLGGGLWKPSNFLLEAARKAKADQCISQGTIAKPAVPDVRDNEKRDKARFTDDVHDSGKRPRGRVIADAHDYEKRPRGRVIADADGYEKRPKGRVTADAEDYEKLPRGRVTADADDYKKRPRCRVTADVDDYEKRPRGRVTADANDYENRPKAVRVTADAHDNGKRPRGRITADADDYKKRPRGRVTADADDYEKRSRGRVTADASDYEKRPKAARVTADAHDNGKRPRGRVTADADDYEKRPRSRVTADANDYEKRPKAARVTADAHDNGKHPRGRVTGVARGRPKGRVTGVARGRPKARVKDGGNASKVHAEESNATPGPSGLLRSRRCQGRQKTTAVSEEMSVPAQSIVDKNIKSDEKSRPIWLSLTASADQVGNAPLPQIPSPYLRIQDGSLPVSFIQKYLAQKLNLASESEVEVSLMGQPLFSQLQLCKVVDWYVQTASSAEKIQTTVGSSAKDFVMVLTYARNEPPPRLPRKYFKRAYKHQLHL